MWLQGTLQWDLKFKIVSVLKTWPILQTAHHREACRTTGMLTTSVQQYRETVQRHCQSWSGSLTTVPCSYSTWEQMTLQGETWTVLEGTTELWGGGIVKGMGAQAVFSVLPVKWKDTRKRALGCRTSVGNRFLGSVTMGPCLRISICLGKAGFISLNCAKTALLGGWLSRHQLRGMKNKTEAIGSKQRGVDETGETKSKQRGLDAAPRRVTISQHVQQPQSNSAQACWKRAKG